jgi:hypothetical protein
MANDLFQHSTRHLEAKNIIKRINWWNSVFKMAIIGVQRLPHLTECVSLNFTRFTVCATDYILTTNCDCFLTKSQKILQVLILSIPSSWSRLFLHTLGLIRIRLIPDSNPCVDCSGYFLDNLMTICLLKGLFIFEWNDNYFWWTGKMLGVTVVAYWNVFICIHSLFN